MIALRPDERAPRAPRVRRVELPSAMTVVHRCGEAPRGRSTRPIRVVVVGDEAQHHLPRQSSSVWPNSRTLSHARSSGEAAGVAGVPGVPCAVGCYVVHRGSARLKSR